MAIRRKRRNTKKQNEIAKRRKEALALRLAGRSYQEIADHFGVSKYTAYHDVNDELADIPKEAASKLRRQEGLRLDQLQSAVWLDAMKGDTEAVKAALKVIDRRARMLGLDAPSNVNVTGGTTNIDEAVQQFIEATQEPHRQAEQPADTAETERPEETPEE